ncbi:hypothetical protein SNEBB_009149 [Seison nebaliae]|nr:hypothetical protein SNEBB_009149 [Seison nebaliae]
MKRFFENKRIDMFLFNKLLASHILVIMIYFKFFWNDVTSTLTDLFSHTYLNMNNEKMEESTSSFPFMTTNSLSIFSVNRILMERIGWQMIIHLKQRSISFHNRIETTFIDDMKMILDKFSSLSDRLFSKQILPEIIWTNGELESKSMKVHFDDETVQIFISTAAASRTFHMMICVSIFLIALTFIWKRLCKIYKYFTVDFEECGIDHFNECLITFIPSIIELRIIPVEVQDFPFTYPKSSQICICYHSFDLLPPPLTSTLPIFTETSRNDQSGDQPDSNIELDGKIDENLIETDQTEKNNWTPSDPMMHVEVPYFVGPKDMECILLNNDQVFPSEDNNMLNGDNGTDEDIENKSILDNEHEIARKQGILSNLAVFCRETNIANQSTIGDPDEHNSEKDHLPQRSQENVKIVNSKEDNIYLPYDPPTNCRQVHDDMTLQTLDDICFEQTATIYDTGNDKQINKIKVPIPSVAESLSKAQVPTHNRENWILRHSHEYLEKHNQELSMHQINDLIEETEKNCQVAKEISKKNDSVEHLEFQHLVKKINLENSNIDERIRYRRPSSIHLQQPLKFGNRIIARSQFNSIIKMTKEIEEKEKVQVKAKSLPKFGSVGHGQPERKNIPKSNNRLRMKPKKQCTSLLALRPQTKDFCMRPPKIKKSKNLFRRENFPNAPTELVNYLKRGVSMELATKFFKMNFNFKNLQNQANLIFSRTKQAAEERLGHAEKTVYDDEFEHLCANADLTATWSDKIKSNLESVIDPNPLNRTEDMIMSKFDDKPLPPRSTYTEMLGNIMRISGEDFGRSSPYGSALIKVGESQQKIGWAEQEFIMRATNSYLQPIRSFLNGDMKNIIKERNLLEQKRLQMDAITNKLKKGESSNKNEARAAEAKREFERQYDITKLLLNQVPQTQEHHLRCLMDFVDSQIHYYKSSAEILENLKSQLSGGKHSKRSETKRSDIAQQI